ncbi:MAG: hypothetical protein HQK55_02825 [Deltaproteobacteria bacterium]|nr:hypothetical protein [Deltaproteobacteria bacterium]
MSIGSVNNIFNSYALLRPLDGPKLLEDNTGAAAYKASQPDQGQTTEKNDGNIQSNKADDAAGSEKKAIQGIGQKYQGKLNQEEERVVSQLSRVDQEVRAHEQAHLSAGGQYVRGGAHYQYKRGPDNRQYAVGGEVSIDSSPVSDDPKATIQKAHTIKRAALAPANPSGQDRQVAAAATQMEIQAVMELMKLQNPSAANSVKGDENSADKTGAAGLYSANGRALGRSPPSDNSGQNIDIYI